MENNPSSTAVTSDGPQSAFTRSLEGFRRRLSAEDLENFELGTFESLELAIKEIQRNQAQRRALRNLNKIKPFLRFLQDYARVIEQFVSAKPDFLAFIWGPIKLCLQIASRLNEAFDALLDAYARIGEALPIFSAIDALFASHHHGHVQKILADVYEDILTFHKRAVVFFKQPVWRITFHTTIHSFEDKFGDVIKNLERSKELLVQSASVSHFQEAQDARLFFIQEFRAQREHERREQTMTTVNWLSSVSSKDEHDKIQEKRREFPGTTQWVFNTASFCGWLRNDESYSPVFWLHGIPGAGKTFLFNSIIDGVNARIPWVHFVYFYCKYNDPAKRSLNGIARSLIAQILVLNPACLNYLHDSALSSGESTLGSVRLCTEILKKLAEHHDQLIVGIDGLDECEEPEKRPVLAMIDSILKATKATGNVRFILTSRKEPVIERSLRSASALEIRPHHVERDIKIYIRLRASKLGEMYSFDAERQQQITTEISNRSQGMFLLARLVIDNLLNQDCREDLEEELNNKTLPNGIDEAYGRILVRMQKKEHGGRTWERAKLALDLLVMATNPVKTNDIQGALSIRLDDRSIDFQGRRSVKPLEDLLGPLVEIHLDGSVNFVHPTARDFLLQHHSNYFIDPSAANFRLARLCTSYLTFQCFSSSRDGPSIKDSVERADYAFQEYATFNWIHHLRSLKSHEWDLNEYEPSSLRQSFALLHQQHLEEDAEVGVISGNEITGAGNVHVVEELNALRSVYERVDILHRADDLEKPMPHLLRRLYEVRKILEELLPPAVNESPRLTEAYGRSLYKCPITRCARFFRGFGTRRQRDEHLQGHERSYKCSEKDCDYSELGFVSERELSKHVQLCHGTSSQDFIFPNVRPVSTSKALNDAIDRDDALAIRDICDPVTVNTINETGFLLRAIRKKSLNAAMVVMELLGTTNEVNHRDKRGTTAIHEAMVDVKFEKLLKEILTAGFDVHTRDRGGLNSESLLVKALCGSHFHAVRILLSVDGIDLKSCNKFQLQKGVLLAATEGDDDMLEILFAIAANATPIEELSKWISLTLNNAALYNHESTVSLILKLGRNMGIEGHYKGILKKELPKGLEAITKLLMKRAVDKGIRQSGELHQAAGKGDSATVTRLLEEGADINYGAIQVPTALAAASRSNRVAMMKLLLDKGAKVDARGGESVTPLGAASSTGQMAAIQLLLDKGADPDYGIYPASRKGQTAIIELLLGKGAYVNAYGEHLDDPLNAACLKGHKATVKLLLKNGAGIYARGETADIEFGETWSIEQEVAVRGYGRQKGLYSALCVACGNHQGSLVQLLIELLERSAATEGQKPGKYSNALLRACVSKADLQSVQLLLQCGADANYGPDRPLQQACYVGNHGIVQLLLEYGADVDGRDETKDTALMMAASFGHEEIVKMLLKQGADINAQSNSHGTALIAAARKGKNSSVQLLLENGADPNKPGLDTDSNNLSALSSACRGGNLDVVRLLLKHGADVNAGSGEALKAASSKGDDALVQLLLEYGAQP